MRRGRDSSGTSTAAGRRSWCWTAYSPTRQGTIRPAPICEILPVLAMLPSHARARPCSLSSGSLLAATRSRYGSILGRRPGIRGWCRDYRSCRCTSTRASARHWCGGRRTRASRRTPIPAARRSWCSRGCSRTSTASTRPAPGCEIHAGAGMRRSPGRTVR